MTDHSLLAITLEMIFTRTLHNEISLNCESDFEATTLGMRVMSELLMFVWNVPSTKAFYANSIIDSLTMCQYLGKNLEGIYQA